MESDVSRRGFLGASTLTAGIAGTIGAIAAADEPKQEYGGHERSAEELPTFRYAIEENPGGHKTEGGSAKQATVKELPISKGLAGVSMRLNPGGIRELHWHAIAAEWAFVIKGRVRTTVIGPDGTSEVNDFDPGDVWYFPRGHGHLLQGLGPEEAHFVLIFDDGAFSEFGTFSSTDWLGHTAPDVLSRSLGLPASAFAQQFPKKELYIVQGRIPPQDPPAFHQGGQNLSHLTHRYPLLAQKPHSTFAGGEERRVSAREFPISTTMTGVVLDLKPGALREPHWHPNADEWQYIIRGRARIGLFGSDGRARTEEFKQGDAGYIPRGYGHYVDNIGDEPLRVLIGFNSGDYQEISLSTWLAANPDAVLADNFKVPDALIAQLPKRRVFIGSKEGPGV
jgi:oxalate decarboxylase